MPVVSSESSSDKIRYVVDRVSYRADFVLSLSSPLSGPFRAVFLTSSLLLSVSPLSHHVSWPTNIRSLIASEVVFKLVAPHATAYALLQSLMT